MAQRTNTLTKRGEALAVILRFQRLLKIGQMLTLHPDCSGTLTTWVSGAAYPDHFKNAEELVDLLTGGAE